MRSATLPETSLEGFSDGRKTTILQVQSAVLKTMVETLLEKGFLWVLPIMLSRATDPLWPDSSSSIEQRITLPVYGQPVKTMQSMILHKRALVSLGPGRFFILSPNIRIESRERAGTGWHLYEFTQLEVEAANWRMRDLFTLFEALLSKTASTLRREHGSLLSSLGRNPPTPRTPFKVYRRGSLESEYGEAWEEEVSKAEGDPVWVTDLPREFYDYEDEETGAWRNFDLLLPEGYGEAVSGAEREYEYDKILKKLRRDGLDPQDYQPILRLAEQGRLKPSCGAGLGVERLIAYLCGVDHVAEVQPFPRIPGVVPEL